MAGTMRRLGDFRGTDMKKKLKNIFFPAGTGRRGVGFRAMLVMLLAFGVAAPRSVQAYYNMGNDRILLMNNDSHAVEAGGISHQGYYDTNAVTVVDGVESVGTYWTHTPDLDNTVSSTRYLLHGDNHILHTPEGEPLWRLVSCRAGYVAAGTSGRNTLPCSRYAQISYAPGATASLTTPVAVYPDPGSTKKVNIYSCATNACVIMQNTTEAKVYSPLYKDGIGTLYFDTVNSFTAATDGAIALQIATNLTEDAETVGNVAFEDVEKQVDFAQWDDYYNWQTVPMTILEIDGSTINTMEGVTNLLMLVTDGGTKHYFRSRTLFNYYGPIRFRICRLTADPGPATASVDSRGLILIDNIIASYPPATVRLERYGEPYDPSLKGTSVIGCVGDFDKPFLSYADTNVNTSIHFSWVTNFQGTTQNLRLTAPRFNYRWRYLDQKVNNWTNILLSTNKNVKSAARVDFLVNAANTQLVSVTGIPLADGVGDLEYFYSATVSAPYYQTRDYANESSKFGRVPGTTKVWTEAITAVTNRLEVAEDFRTPALGSHHFTRVREGISDYKWVKLCTSVTTNGTDGVKKEDIRMELVGDHTWRTHYYVPTNMVGEKLSFHFQGELLFTNEWFVGYQSRTNTWYCDLKELPYIPYTSAAGLGYHEDISCRLDDAATHLKIEFNDELLSFSICHSVYQDFNAWTDATPGYLGHTNWNGMGAIGVSEKKKKYVLTTDDGRDAWKPTSFEDPRWTEEFDTDDVVTYPLRKIFDEHRTPNGWTAGHGQFLLADRALGLTVSPDVKLNMSLQMEGRGQGWVGMEGFEDGEMPKGVDTVKFRARIAQEPRFEDFAWYMDGTSMANYAVSARLAMGHRGGGTLYNSPDTSPGTPSVSLVGYYRPTVGCYEFRLTRCGQEQLCAALYKWQPKSTGMEATLLVSNVVALTDVVANARPGPEQESIKNFGNYLVTNGSTSSSDNEFTGSNAYLLIGRTGNNSVYLCGALSSNRTGTSLKGDESYIKKLVVWTDRQKVLTKGTIGIGSTDCAATFAGIATHKVETLSGSSTPQINMEAAYQSDQIANGDWAFYGDRWKDRSDTTISSGGRAHIFAVVPTNQTVRLEFKTANSGEGWKPSGLEQIINSFGTNMYSFVSRVSPDYQVRLRTGGNSYDDVRTDVVVDEIAVTSWRAPNYKELARYYGQAEEWVYMCGVVTNVSGTKCVSLQPSRGVPEKAMGLRSPYLENGISMFSANYRNADAHAKLLLQICTNLSSMVSVSETITTYPPSYSSYWDTVATFNFSTMTATERQSGTITHYMSYRAPVHGLVRLVVDESVIQYCRDNETSSSRNVNYGQIFIESAYCYDEPALDMRSWYAWNFHSVGWNTDDKRFAYLFDSPDGLSGSLNFSALNSENTAAAAQGIGLVDQQNLAAYAANNSFVQCPPITNGIGSVSFRARTFETGSDRKSSWVTLYGSFEPDDDQVVAPESWVRITDFEVTNTTYQTFSWSTTDDNSQYKAIRLEVAGSRHGRAYNSYSGSANDWERPKATPLQRVLIDEMSVGEPIQPRIVFRNVRPFRSGVVDIPPKVVDNIADLSEQPLIGESWGIQCTIEPQQMSEQLDDESIKVFAAFKRGISPWGYANWSNEVTAVQLDRVAGTLTFRSSYNTAASIISPVDTPSAIYPENVWQYFLWCEFTDKEGNKHRHNLDRIDWTVPSWYLGLQDLNETYSSQGFAGYTILDTISPKRAWINEINICDTGLFDNSDGKKQFIEIAAPRGADISNWRINVMGSGLRKGSIATYGYGNAKINPSPKVGKTLGIDWTNDYTVVALRSPEAATAGTVANADGAWDNLDATTCNLLQLSGRGSLYYYETYGIELVRPSGIIEHQVIVQGTNVYAGTEWAVFGDGTNLLNKALAADPGSQWFFAGCDQTPSTLGVFRSHGEDESCWTNTLVASAAELNKFDDGTRQIIDPNWFLKPNGTNVWIYATVLGDHIHQAIGDKKRNSEVFIIRKGSSTNIVYTADKWWCMGEVTTNGVKVAAAQGRGDRADNHTWTLELPNVTETMNVFADEQAGSDVAATGIDPNDPYFPAVMDWLASKDDENGLYMAEDWDLANVKKGTLGIKDMYWLDIDPTEPGWVLKSGMGGNGIPAVHPEYLVEGGTVYTNDRVTVTMMITNKSTRVARKPDHLLGLEPGSSSAFYDLYSPAWTSVTFKIVGALQNGDPAVESSYMPLRWFVFGPNSFGDDFTATIDIWDTHSRNSPGWFYGWGDFPGVPVWYKFRLDGEPAYYDTAEVLDKSSTYTE